MNLIRNRFTAEVIFEGEAQSLKSLIEEAVTLHIDLSAANLAGADLRGAQLGHGIFCGAKLTNANLTEARLYEANLEGSDLTGADLSDAKIVQVAWPKHCSQAPSPQPVSAGLADRGDEASPLSRDGQPCSIILGRAPNRRKKGLPRGWAIPIP